MIVLDRGATDGQPCVGYAHEQLQLRAGWDSGTGSGARVRAGEGVRDRDAGGDRCPAGRLAHRPRSRHTAGAALASRVS